MLTDRVSMTWLNNQGMTRSKSIGFDIGVPVDIDNPSKGLKWVDFFDLTDEDFDVIEIYYDKKNSLNP